MASIFQKRRDQKIRPKSLATKSFYPASRYPAAFGNPPQMRTQSAVQQSCALLNNYRTIDPNQPGAFLTPSTIGCRSRVRKAKRIKYREQRCARNGTEHTSWRYVIKLTTHLAVLVLPSIPAHSWKPPFPCDSALRRFSFS